jgi:hypothetical protein
MRTFRLLSLACFGALLVAGACGDDQALVRPRLDAGTADASDIDASAGALTCGVVRPAVYESANFATNAAVELALGQGYAAIEEKMRSADVPDAGSTVTASDLKAVFSAGSPSLRAVSTPEAQNAVDAYFDAFEAAGGKTWTPEAADQDGGATTGGVYGSARFSPIGVDLTEAVTKILIQGAFYNHAAGIAAAPVNDAAIDRLVAAYGASVAFLNRSAADAGDQRDVRIAAYASMLDGDPAGAPGPYRRIKNAFLTMKAAVAGGDKCKADLDAALSVFFAEWERTAFGMTIFYLNRSGSLIADPSKGAEALHTFGGALGFIESFYGVPRRKVTDGQLDSLSTKMGKTSPWKLVTAPGDRVVKLNEAISDIALYQGLSPTDVEAFKNGS